MLNGMVCGEKTSKILCAMHQKCRPLKKCVIVDCIRSTASKSGVCHLHNQACENSKVNYRIKTKFRKLEKSYLKALPMNLLVHLLGE
jgi:hypothetical protein